MPPGDPAMRFSSSAISAREQSLPGASQFASCRKSPAIVAPSMTSGNTSALVPSMISGSSSGVTPSMTRGTPPSYAVGTTFTPPPPHSPMAGDSFPDADTSKKKGILPPASTNVMKTWLFQHILHPYPSEDEKQEIVSGTGLSLHQVNNWFINARRRILQPLLQPNPNHPAGGTLDTEWCDRIKHFTPEQVKQMVPQLSSDDTDIGAPLPDNENYPNPL